MDHGFITIWAESKVTDNGGYSKLIGTEHKPYGNGHKPAERGFTGETGFKVAQNIFNKI